MKFIRYLLLVMSTSVLLVIACKKKDTTPPPPASALSVDSTTLTLANVLNSKDSFAITANVGWTISVSPASNWLSITPLTGTGNQKIMLVAAQANNSGNPQTATITITPAASSSLPAKTITLTQSSAAPVITSFAPLHAKGGDIVTITGLYFSTTPLQNVVKFNGKSATVTAGTSTSLNVTVPSLAGSGPITIEIGPKVGISQGRFNYDTVWNVNTLAGSNRGNIDGNYSTVLFDNPNNISINQNGNLFITDYNNNIVRIIDTLTKNIHTLKNSGGLPYNFNGPNSVGFSGDSIIYVVENTSNTIKKITSGGLNVFVGGSGGTVAGYNDGQGTSALFSSPTGMVVDGKGNLFVVDNGNKAIRKVSNSGLVTTIAGGPTSNQFNNPYFLALDGKGNLFVSDYGNNRICKIDTATKAVTILAGGASGNHDGQGLNARFNSPTGIAVDNNDNLYICDFGNFSIRKIDVGGNVSTIATNLSNDIEGIAVDNGGKLYIVDSQNNKILILTAQ